MDNSSPKTHLVLCGSIAIDRIMNFNGRYSDLIQPDKLHVLSLSVLLDKLENTRGGVAANIAHNLALLGNKSVLFGSVGKDAAEYIADLLAMGVDTQFVHMSDLATASFNVMTDMDDSQVGGFYPGAMSDSGSLSLQPWAERDVLVCISAHDPVLMRSQVEECRNQKIRLMYDPGQQVSNVPGEDLTAGIDTAEILAVNDYELSVLADKIGRSADDVKKNVPIVITTLGSNGSVIEGAGISEPIVIGVTPPAQVVDPTGAGDAYRAGFLYGYLRQWNLRICGQLGSTVASFIVEQHGTQRQFSKQDIITRYQDNFNEEITL